MKITNFLWLIALCLFVASCNRNNIPHTENPLSNANNKFAFDFLQQINAIGQLYGIVRKCFAHIEQPTPQLVNSKLIYSITSFHKICFSSLSINLKSLCNFT